MKYRNCALAILGWVLILQTKHVGAKALPHTFNAHLTDQGEKRLSIFGNFTLGLNDNFQLEVQGLAFLLGYQNVGVKHKMLDFGDTKTSFSGNVYYLSAEDIEAIFGVYQFLNSTEVYPKTWLSFGLNTGYAFLSSRSSGMDAKADIRIYTASLAVDYSTTNGLFSFIALYPIQLKSSLQDDFMNAEIKLNLPLGQNLSSALMMATYTFTSGNPNFEIGLTGYEYLAIYFNFIWRWN